MKNNVDDINNDSIYNDDRVRQTVRNREINYTVMSREEFDFRKKRRDPFLLGVLAGSRVMIIGDEEDLVG